MWAFQEESAVTVAEWGAGRPRLLDFMHACLPPSCSCEQQAIHRMCHVIIHHQGPMNGEQHNAFWTVFSPVRGKTWSISVFVCVCVMSLCIRLCIHERVSEWECEREWRWANEQARENFCVCERSTSLRGIFSIVFFCFFQHIQQSVFQSERSMGLSCISQSHTLLWRHTHVK